MKKYYFLFALLVLSFVTFGQINSPDTTSSVTITGFGGFKQEQPILEEDMYVKGELDASRNYKKYKGAATGTLIASLVSPLIGLIPAIACSASTPKLENLGYPDERLFTQKDYNRGYTKKAKKIKGGKVWKNWGIGFGVNLVLVLIIAGS